MQKRKRIALLIDCDNISHTAIGGVLEELAQYGMVNVRHAHGDWHNPLLSGWQGKLQPHTIRPMQQFAYTKGKNATDSAMIIDAMDLLHGQTVDAFALMTSDSDFTPLVLRIRESGIPVYGFGAKKTPQPFVDACSPFFYTENLIPKKKIVPTEKPSPKKEKTAVKVKKAPQKITTETPLKQDSKTLNADASLVFLLRTAVEQTNNEGWSHIGVVGSYIAKNNSSFSLKKYGYKKLSDLIKAIQLFNIKKENSAWYIQDKRKQTSESKSCT